jgi:hypothetical protein
MTAKTSAARRKAGMDTAFNVLDGGFFRFYDGTQPTDADAALGSQVLLAECTLNATAFAAATGTNPASKVANAIGDDTSANATGTCTWCTIVTSGGTRVMDMAVGAEVTMNSSSIVAGAKVSVTSLTIQQAA